MGEFIGGVIALFFIIIFAIGIATITSHFDGKFYCEETHNVNHCERNLTYTPTYPEVTE